TRLDAAVRIGEEPDHPLYAGGFSAPELAFPGIVTDQADVYTLGAMLHRALSGRELPEEGIQTAELPAAIPIPGVPQLLSRALAPAEERLSLEDFYRGLLRLKDQRAAPPLSLEVASATTLGLNPTRLVNEDAGGYAIWSVMGAQGSEQRALLCVADGMGGMDAGEVASQTALSTIMEGAAQLLTSPNVSPPDPIDLIRQAAPAVHAAADGRQTGTTVTCTVMEHGELTLGHVGDTRAYLFRSGELKRLTQDHSLVAAMVASGVLSAADAQGHPDSNKVLRSLGGHRELPPGYVDSLEQTLGQPRLKLEASDWLLLCSDGVWGSVADDDIRTVLSEAMSSGHAAEALIQRALSAGAPDNATAIVGRVMSLPA
ncbi:MAG: protein phosphatase 2C domain-containing protein, partial [Chloroflexota bacterium]